MLSILVRRGDWVTAGFLADQLGVTPRSVRSYVTSINRVSPGGDAIESGPLGYRATPAAAELDIEGAAPERGSPRERLLALIRMLAASDEGVDVFETALALRVSPGTIEADLRRIRDLLRGTGLSFSREAAVVTLHGSERDVRRFLARVARDAADEDGGIEAMRRAADRLHFDTAPFAEVGRDLADALADLGYVVNELAIADVVLHISIAADRAARGHGIPDEGAPGDLAPIARAVAAIARERFGAELTAGDAAHLASLVTMSVVEPGTDAQRETDPLVASAVRDATDRVARDYDVDIDVASLAERLAPLVDTLVRRAREQLSARNPMTRSLKAASPLAYEMAVAIAGDVSAALEARIRDDEITDIAMHVGTALDPQRRAQRSLTAALVSPGPDEMRRQLQASIERFLGHELRVVEVEARFDPDWSSFDADVVLTTIEPPARAGIDPERIVRIPPFLSERDLARAADAVSRVRRHRRLSGLRNDMERWFAPSAFVRDIDEDSPEGVIRALGAALVREGVVDEAYVESAIERERLSSTAFTESLAVPHALTMSAERTAIALAVSEQAIAWGDERVHVVALVAFSESDRPAFQTVFEQFVDVFADPDNARRLARRGVDLPSFLTELAALIDAPVRT